MKLSEVLAHKEFTLCLGSGVNWELSMGKISAKIPENLTPDSEVSLNYFWYNHGDRQTQKEIEQALKEKNWNEFSKYYFNKPCPCSLPTFISVSCGEFWLGDLRLCEETFKYITFFEDEHG